MRNIVQKRIASLLLPAAVFIISSAVFVPGVSLGAEKAVSQDTTKFLGRLSDALAEIGEVARPAVVNISTTSTVTLEENPYGDFFNDPFFRHFFGDQFGHPGQKKMFKSAALGSGVIVSENGYILTNNHVVKDAEEIKVILYDKREFKGKVVGADAKTDLAVIKIDAKGLPVLKVGDSAKLKAGDVVLAIGNPFGLNQTVTMGIVSAVGRSNIGLADFEDFIQTDAAINPGNSGGALVNTSGELVGINTAIFSTSGGYMGIGFSIPSDMAKTVLDSIIKYGRVIRGWLGVSIQDLTADLAKSLGVKQKTGVVIADVVKDSPADKAGLKRGDVITHFDGKTIENAIELRNMATATAPGKTAQITIVRDGKERTVTATLEEFKERALPRKVEYNNVLNGLTVENMTPSVRDRLGLPANMTGVVISNISPDSAAQGVLQAGDVILEVDRKGVKSVEEYERIASKIGPRDTVLLLIYREGGTAYVTIGP